MCEVVGGRAVPSASGLALVKDSFLPSLPTLADEAAEPIVLAAPSSAALSFNGSRGGSRSGSRGNIADVPAGNTEGRVTRTRGSFFYIRFRLWKTVPI